MNQTELCQESRNALEYSLDLYKSSYIMISTMGIHCGSLEVKTRKLESSRRCGWISPVLSGKARDKMATQLTVDRLLAKRRKFMSGFILSQKSGTAEIVENGKNKTKQWKKALSTKDSI